METLTAAAGIPSWQQAVAWFFMAGILAFGAGIGWTFGVMLAQRAASRRSG